MTLNHSGIQCPWRVPLDDAVQDSSVGIMLNEQAMPCRIRVDDKIACRVQRHPLWLDGLHDWNLDPLRRPCIRSWVAASVRCHLLTDNLIARLPNHWDKGNLVSECLNLLWGDVLEHGAFAVRPANPPTLINPVGKKAQERLPW